VETVQATILGGKVLNVVLFYGKYTVCVCVCVYVCVRVCVCVRAVKYTHTHTHTLLSMRMQRANMKNKMTNRQIVNKKKRI
jgi:hypothetical protein